MSYTYIEQSSADQLAVDPADVMLVAGDLHMHAVAQLIRMQTRAVEDQCQYAILPCTLQVTGHTEVFLPINPCIKVKSVEKRYIKSTRSVAIDESQYEVTRDKHGVQSVCVAHDAFSEQEQIALSLRQPLAGAPKRYYKNSIAVVVTYEAGPENPMWEIRERYSILKNGSLAHANLVLQKVVSVLTGARTRDSKYEGQLLATSVSRHQPAKL